eukprot:TRINITY_DN14490_c0_g1_i1.p1 TRINITY_DN14490_c0_g1~~TRINITY_DN14490_c0_g1_i1.p1  ORF type:complete len:202 (-),score=4.90 TRINITY_DN14490_c0_g1_i1:27-632(-)
MWTHLMAYSKDGLGLVPCHAVSVVAEIASQFFLSVLLVLISWGWTISYLKFHRPLLLIEMLFTLLVLHLLLGGLTELGNDEYDKYHNYDGIQGVLLTVLRLGMFGYFLYGATRMYRQCSIQIKPFFTTFTIYAGAYLLSFPLLILICQICVPYVRHRIMTIGTIFFQSLALCILLKLFTGNNQYTRISKHKAPPLSSNKTE